MVKTKLIDQVRGLGARITPARKIIVEAFDNKCSPLSASDLNQILLSNDIEVNKTTIYRELDFLRASGILKEVSFGDGKVRYERNFSECHHHVVCTNCGKIEDVEIKEQAILSEAAKKSSFEIKTHSIEFFGLCKQCH